MCPNNQNKISVIVAIYNTENYLQKCVNSIINQTHKNLEIILIDDGSFDSCPQICDEYQKLDNRVKVIHKSNGGQGSARNIALDRATGEWVGFVDSDDWIDSDMFEFLLDKALSENADIVECGWKKLNVDDIVEFKTPSKIISINRKKAMNALVYGRDGGINTSVCNKIFSRRCIANIRFPEVRAYEDDEFIHKVIWNTQKIFITGVPKYNYLIRPESTMNSSFNLNKVALITVQDNICEFLKVNAPQYFNMAQRVLCSKYFYILYQLKYNTINPQKQILQEIEQRLITLSRGFIINPLMGVNRIILLIYKVTPKLAYFIIKQKFRLQK